MQQPAKHLLARARFRLIVVIKVVVVAGAGGFIGGPNWEPSVRLALDFRPNQKTFWFSETGAAQPALCIEALSREGPALKFERLYAKKVKELPHEARLIAGKAILDFYRSNPDHPRLDAVVGPRPK
jgi:hypothetical protein